MKNQLKKIVLLGSIIACSLTCFSQSSTWTKDDRNTIYQNFMDALTKYQNITTDQKESIALCCLNSITDKYTKADYNSKIDIEIKRIQEATISTCAKNDGINLDNASTKQTSNTDQQSSTDKSTYAAKDFEGIWSFEGGVYTFYAANGQFTETSPTRQGTANGNWHIEGNRLILVDGRFLANWGSATYIIISVSSTEIVLAGITSNVTYHLKKG